MSFKGTTLDKGKVLENVCDFSDDFKVETSNVAVASISQYEYEHFLKANVETTELDYSLKVFDSSQDIESLIEILNRYEAEVVMTAWSSKRFIDDMLQRVPALKYVAHITGSVTNLIPRSLIENGLIVTNWGDSISRTVAEHCLLQMMAGLRRVTRWQIDMHVHKLWRTKHFQTCTLFDKKVGIHGFGGCARELVKLMRPFNCRINAYSPSVPDEMLDKLGVARSCSLEELFSENDVIVDLAALTPANYKIIDERLLRMIPKGGVFVNCGRGKVIDESDLCKIAKEGNIQIALDVFETEPLAADSPLRGCDNVFLTPHIGGPTIDERKVCGRKAIENVSAYFKAIPMNSIVGLTEYDRMT